VSQWILLRIGEVIGPIDGRPDAARSETGLSGEVKNRSLGYGREQEGRDATPSLPPLMRVYPFWLG
jgi:hypothetical protein